MEEPAINITKITTTEWWHGDNRTDSEGDNRDRVVVGTSNKK